DGVRFDGEGRAGTAGNQLVVLGNGTNSGLLTPSGAVPGNGTLTLDGRAVTFTGVGGVQVRRLSSFGLSTGAGAGQLTVDTATGGAGEPANRVAGSSGGVSFAPLTFFDVFSFTLTTGAGNDAITIGSGGFVARGLTSFAV